MSLRIFVAENNEVIRSVVCALLVAHPGWEVCGEAADGAEALLKIPQLKPDIVLLDFNLPNRTGLEITRELLQGWTPYKIIILIATETDPVIREIFEAGARGFVVRTRSTQELALAVEALRHGRTFFTPRYAEFILKGRLASDENSGMSEWQRESVRRLALELATPSRHHWPPVNLLHPLRKYALVAFFLAVVAAAGWVTYLGDWHRVMPEIDQLSVKAGINPSPSPASNRGNPDRKVWIDVNTAQYYCPSSALYGRTARGRFAKQRDAQADHYEPSGMKACE